MESMARTPTPTPPPLLLEPCAHTPVRPCNIAVAYTTCTAVCWLHIEASIKFLITATITSSGGDYYLLIYFCTTSFFFRNPTNFIFRTFFLSFKSFLVGEAKNYKLLDERGAPNAHDTYHRWENTWAKRLRLKRLEMRYPQLNRPTRSTLVLVYNIIFCFNAAHNRIPSPHSYRTPTSTQRAHAHPIIYPVRHLCVFGICFLFFWPLYFQFLYLFYSSTKFQ